MYAAASDDEKHIQRYLSANCFGDYLTRAGIDVETRELLTFSMLVALGGADAQVKGHVAANLQCRQRPRRAAGRADPAAAVHRLPAHAQRAARRQRGRTRPQPRRNVMTQRIWLITGVSSGFGRHLTEQLLDRGDRVIGTVRTPGIGRRLHREVSRDVPRRGVDVRDIEAIRAVVDRAVADFGRIDVAVNNAGYGLFGAAEELSDEQVVAIIATNLTAPIQMIRAVLPHMRKARRWTHHRDVELRRTSCVPR